MSIKLVKSLLWTNWSASKIKTFRLCPRLFLLLYVLGIKVPKLVWQAIGEIEHYLFKIGIRQNYKSVYSFVKMALCYTTNYKDRGYKQKVLLRNDEEKKIKRNRIGLLLCKCKTFFEENLDYHTVKKGKKIIKEGLFQVPETEKRIVFFYKGLKITSIIDRINFSGDDYIVIDYKTSKDFPEVYNRDIQYTLYDIAATHIYNKSPREISISTYLHPQKKDAVCRENFEVVMDALSDKTLTEKEINFRRMVDNLPTGKFEHTKIDAKNDNMRQEVLDIILDASEEMRSEFQNRDRIKFCELVQLDNIFRARDGRHCHYCVQESNCTNINENGIMEFYTNIFNARCK